MTECALQALRAATEAITGASRKASEDARHYPRRSSLRSHAAGPRFRLGAGCLLRHLIRFVHLEGMLP